MGGPRRTLMRLPLKSLLPVLLLAGAAVTVALVGFERTARRSLESEALLRQQLRANDLVHQFKLGFYAARQASHTAVEVAAGEPDLEERKRLLSGVLRATPSDFVGSLSVWPAPSPAPGAQRSGALHARRAPPGSQDIAISLQPPSPEQDYWQEDWYRRAREAQGEPVFLEPRLVGPDTWRVLACAWLDGSGQVLGVVTVDLWLPHTRHQVHERSQDGMETAFITSPQGRLFAHPEEGHLLDWARDQGREAGALGDLGLEDLKRYEAERYEDPRHLASTLLPGVGWAAHVSSSRPWLFAQVRRQQGLLVLLGMAFWAALITVPLLLQRALTVRELGRRLEERRRMHERLERSERTLRDVLETALDAVVAVREGGHVVEWNAQAERTFGWRKEEVLGAPVPEPLMSVEGAPELRRILELGDAALLHRRLETRARQRGGGIRDVEVEATSVRGEDGDRRYLFLSDITERKRVEAEHHQLLEQLQRQRSELRAIIDTMVDSVMVSDPEGHITLVNKAGQQLLQGLDGDGGPHSLEQLLQKHGARTLAGRPVRLEETPLRRALRGNVVVDADVAIPAPEERQTLYLRTNAAPIRDSAGQVIGAVAVARDVTETVELDHLKDEFVRVAAHELKTPVAIMKSYAQLALKREPSPDVYRKMLDAISRGADRIDHIVRELLDVSQLQLGRLKLTEEPLDLRELAEETAGHMAALSPRHHLSVLSGPPIIIRGDRIRLRQVLVVLLDNAVRYSPSGGRVQVRLSAGEDAVEVCVSDDGIGIPSEHQSRLFERFYRAHSGTPHDRGGMGVGLYISREIVFHHGGTMRVSSEEGRGSTFCFSVPYSVRRSREGGEPAPGWHGDPGP